MKRSAGALAAPEPPVCKCSCPVPGVEVRRLPCTQTKARQRQGGGVPACLSASIRLSSSPSGETMPAFVPRRLLHFSACLSCEKRDSTQTRRHIFTWGKAAVGPFLRWLLCLWRGAQACCVGRAWLIAATLSCQCFFLGGGAFQALQALEPGQVPQKGQRRTGNMQERPSSPLLSSGRGGRRGCPLPTCSLRLLPHLTPQVCQSWSSR